jgi:hypothetical protein
MNSLAEELRNSIGSPGVEEDDFRESVTELATSWATASRAVERSAKFIHAIRSQTLGMNASTTVDFSVKGRLDVVLSFLEHRASSIERARAK